MSQYIDWIKEISQDEGQLEAFNRNGHCVVIAGPGTGKTRILVLKAARILYEEVFPPRGIACVTYAHAMAEELRDQLESLGIASDAYNVFIGTLHSFCFSNILLPFGNVYGLPLPTPLRVASDKLQAKVYASIWNASKELQKLGWDYKPITDENGELAPRLPVEFQRYRRTHLNEADLYEKKPLLDYIVNAYELALLSQKVIDFDLGTKWSVTLVEQHEFIRTALEAKYPWLLIDEYQDLGLALHRIVKILTSQTKIKLFAIGDPNQCIYDFIGATPEYFWELRNDTMRYGSPIYLRVNYRSCPEIIRAAAKIFPDVPEQIPYRNDAIGLYKIINHENHLEILSLVIQKLLKNVAPGDIMVLSRTNDECTQIVDYLKQNCPDIPVSKSPGQVYKSRSPLLEWIELLILYTVGNYIDVGIRFNELCPFWGKLLETSGDLSGALSFHNRLRLFSSLSFLEQFSGSAIQWLEKLIDILKLEPLLEQYGFQSPEDIDEFEKLKHALSADGQWNSFSLLEIASLIKQKNRVKVITLHSSKGQQSLAVILANIESLNTTKKDQQPSRRRLFYVGMTRAKDVLLLLYGGRSYLVRNFLLAEN